MAQVYHSKELSTLIDHIDFSKLGGKVGIKVHFGERGCNTYLSPGLVRVLYDRLEGIGKDVSLIETNVLYKGSRVNTAEHIKTARQHGFDMKIDILDGDLGDEYFEVDGCKLAKGLQRYDSLIILSHFKGHIAAGFGGALKNIGMGLGSRAGKLDMHSKIKPSINSNCVGCGVCVERCNADAIEMIDNKARIDDDKCVGCAMCIAVCNSYAVTVPWAGRTSEELQRKIVDYAAAVLGRFPNTLFINALVNVTKECDCMGIDQTPIMEDAGYLMSEDIVAVESASLSMAEELSRGKFTKVNSVNKVRQIEVAEKAGLGKRISSIINC